MKRFVRLFLLIILYNSFVLTYEDCPNVVIKNGRARKKHIFMQYSCNKRFILFGSKFATCQNSKWNTPPPVCVRNRCTALREISNGDLLPFNKGGTIQFWCKSGYTLRGSSIIYCDGTRWNDTTPFCNQNGKKPPLSCDFESNNLCGWVQDVNHDFDWTKYNLNTTTWHIQYGPAYDHTKGPNGNGFYMFVDASKSVTAETARLISPIYDKVATNVCFEFFYHMRHNGNGMLNVRRKYLKDNNWPLSNDTIIFTRTGYHGNKWNRAYVNLGILIDDYQIIFEATRGDAAECDIAFDDVRIIEDCTYVDEDIYTTTEYYDVEEIATEQELSCKDQCFNDTGTCSCKYNCDLLSTCCADFFFYCLNDYLEYSTTLDSETYLTTEEDVNTELYDEETTSTTPTTTSTMKSIKNVTKTAEKVNNPITVTESNWIKTDIIRQHVTSTVKITSTARSNNAVPITKTTRVVPIVVIKQNKTNVEQKRPIIKNITDTKAKSKEVVISKTKITKPTVITNDVATSAKIKPTKPSIIKHSSSDTVSNEVNVKLTKTTTKATYLNRNNVTANIKVINFHADGITSKPSIVIDKESNVITRVLETKQRENGNTSSNVLLIGSIAIIGTIVLLSLTILIYKKCKITNYINGKNIARRKNTSESDIRYLTSDEALDFRLALLQDDYDEM